MCIKGDCPSGAESFARYAFLTEQGYIDFYGEYFYSLLEDCKPLIQNKDDDFSCGTDHKPDNSEKLAQIIQNQMGCNGVDKEYIKKRIDECTQDESWNGVWDNSGRPSSLDDFMIGS